MKIEIGPGEQVEIVFRDADGGFTVEWQDEIPGDESGLQAISVTTLWPDSQGRDGVIYYEEFGGPVEEIDQSWSGNESEEVLKGPLGQG